MEGYIARREKLKLEQILGYIENNDYIKAFLELQKAIVELDIIIIFYIMIISNSEEYFFYNKY